MAIDSKYYTFEDTSLQIMKDVFGPILNREVGVNVASVEDASEGAIAAIFSETPVVVEAPIEGAVSGMQYYIFSQKLAAGVTDLMVMGDGTAPFIEDEALDGISEAVNQIVGAQCTQWSDELGTDLKAGGAQGRLATADQLGIPWNQFALIKYEFNIADWGDEIFIKLSATNVMDFLAGGTPGGPGLDDNMSDPFAQPQMGGAPPAGDIKRAQFGDFGSSEAFRGQDEDPSNLDLLLDISLPVTIELGRTKMLIREVLEIGPGSVIELQKLSGEPVDLYINEKRFALGEVVVIDENFGIRITELLSVEDRIQALK